MYLEYFQKIMKDEKKFLTHFLSFSHTMLLENLIRKILFNFSMQFLPKSEKKNKIRIQRKIKILHREFLFEE